MLELVFSVEVVHFGCVFDCVFDTLPCYLQFVLQMLLLVATPVLVLLLLVGVYLGEFRVGSRFIWGWFRLLIGVTSGLISGYVRSVWDLLKVGLGVI